VTAISDFAISDFPPKKCEVAVTYICKFLHISQFSYKQMFTSTELPRSIYDTFLCDCYGVASSSRLLKIIGLFCKRALQKRPIFSKETYNFKEPTTRSHPIHPRNPPNRETHSPRYLAVQFKSRFSLNLNLYREI